MVSESASPPTDVLKSTLYIARFSRYFIRIFLSFRSARFSVLQDGPKSNYQQNVLNSIEVCQ